MLSVFFILLSFCRADVAFVEFNDGDLSGSIRFEQDDGSSEVTIISNVLDTSNSHGASISWTVYHGGVSTCENKGSQKFDLTSLLDSELRIGYASYTTNQFQVRDLFSTTLVLGLDVGCSEIVEIPEALRVYSTISWDAAVGNDVIEEAKVKTAESFDVDTNHVFAVPYYPVTVETTLTNLPESSTDESLRAYVSQSLRLILDLSEIDDVDVTVFPSASPTEKDLTFVVTSYTNGTYIFLYDHISSSPTFLPQLEGTVNVFGAYTEGNIWVSSMTINNVELKTTLALTTVDVSDQTYTSLDIGDLVESYEENLLTIDPPATLVEYTIHSETKTPSVSPSLGPSVQPSKSPSTIPTVQPSDAPSVRPSTAPICGPDDNSFLGDPSIQLSDEQSQYASGNFEMTVVFPFKFTPYQLRFVGDTSEAYNYDLGDAEDPWVSSDAKCLKQMTVTIPWSAIQDGSVGISWNGETNTFDGVFDLHLKETITKEGSQTLGDTFERDVEYEMPFSILMHTSIVTEADISISISDPTLTSTVLNGLQVVVPDGENPSVTVLFCTEMPYPWVLEVPSPSSDFALTGTDVRLDGTQSLTEISQETCNTFGSSCTQCWQAQWFVNEVCKESGDYLISLPAQYLQVPPYADEVNVDITMRLALMPSCEVTIATVEPTGSLVMYPDATYATSSLVFYIDSEAWGRISVDALQDIESLTLGSLVVKQDGVSQSLQTSAFEYEEVDRTAGDVATIGFKCRFTLSELSGEVSGKPTVITAELTIVYVDGSRRRLQVTTGENDVPMTEAKAETTIVLLEGPCSLPYGRLDEIRYDSCAESSKQQIMHCLSSGWSVLSHCPTQNVEVESITTETDDELPWSYFTLALGAVIGLGFVLHWSFTSYCSTGKGDNFTFTPAPQTVGDKI